MKSIIGKTVWFNREGRRSGKVVHTEATKRGLKSLTVVMAGMSPKGKLGFYGSRVRVFPENFTGEGVGVLFRGKLEPIPFAESQP